MARETTRSRQHIAGVVRMRLAYRNEKLSDLSRETRIPYATLRDKIVLERTPLNTDELELIDDYLDIGFAKFFHPGEPNLIA